MRRPASQAALKTVVATCEVPPPTSSAYSLPMMTGAEAEPALDRPLADRLVEREGPSRRDERVVERAHAELEVRDAVGRPRVVRLVGRHAAVDPHRQRLRRRALRRGAHDGELRDPVRRPGGGSQDRARGLRDVQLEPVAGRHDLDRLAVDGEARVLAGRPTLSESLRKYASAAAPPIPSFVEPFLGRLSSSAMRQRGTRKLRSAALTTTGRERARRARSAGCREHLRVHLWRRDSYRERDRAGRPLDLSERTHDHFGGRLAIETAPSLLGHDLDPQTSPHERGAPRAPIDVRSDPVEHVLERGVRDRESREHLGTEDARAKAPEAAERAEPVARAPGGGDGSAPVGLHGELVRRERVRGRAGRELDRIVRALLVEGVELRDGLSLRQPADVDAGDVGPCGELAARAGEGEADEDRQEHSDDGDERDRRPGRQIAATPRLRRAVER